MRLSLTCFALSLGTYVAIAASGPAAPKDREKAIERVKSEQWGEPIGEHVQKLQHRSHKVDGSLLVPVINTWLKSKPLSFYLINRKNKASSMPSLMGKMDKERQFVSLETIEFADVDKDGYGDFTVVAKVRDPKTDQTEIFRGTMVSDRKGSFLPLSSASPTTATVAFDCKPAPLVDKATLAACKLSENKIEFQLNNGTGGIFKLEREVSELPDTIELQGFNHRAVAIAWDGPECTRVEVVSLENGKTLNDTGCQNSRYCLVETFPQTTSECQATIVCNNGGDKIVSTQKPNLCLAK